MTHDGIPGKGDRIDVTGGFPVGIDLRMDATFPQRTERELTPSVLAMSGISIYSVESVGNTDASSETSSGMGPE